MKMGYLWTLYRGQEPCGESIMMDEQRIESIEGLTKLRYSIGEVADLYGIEVSTIRHWEKAFPHLRPRTSRKGTRQYSRKEIEDLGAVHHLVKERGLTIRGAQKELQIRVDAVKRRAEVLQRLRSVKQELAMLRRALDKWERQSLVSEAMQELTAETGQKR